MSGSEKYWDKIKKFGFFSMIFPVVLLIAGTILERKGFKGMVENYDTGMARIVQYIFFGIGVFIFFFCDAIADFFANKLFVKNDDTRLQENLSSYFAYIFIVLWLLNMISVFGFIGYIMCSNIIWLALFIILNFVLQTRYFPSESRFKKLIESVKK
ncbi:MAG TPA: hypothetical protein PKN36_10835 [bacterium]|nr:hypothetical protein [bacterium]